MFAVTVALLIIIISKWEDHVKHQENLVVVGYALSAIGFLGLIFIDKPWQLFVIQVIFGIGEAISVPAFDGLYSRFLDSGKFASEWGAWGSNEIRGYSVCSYIGRKHSAFFRV